MFKKFFMVAIIVTSIFAFSGCAHGPKNNGGESDSLNWTLEDGYYRYDSDSKNIDFTPSSTKENYHYFRCFSVEYTGDTADVIMNCFYYDDDTWTKYANLEETVSKDNYLNPQSSSVYLYLRNNKLEFYTYFGTHFTQEEDDNLRYNITIKNTNIPNLVLYDLD